MLRCRAHHRWASSGVAGCSLHGCSASSSAHRRHCHQVRPSARVEKPCACVENAADTALLLPCLSTAGRTKASLIKDTRKTRSVIVVVESVLNINMRCCCYRCRIALICYRSSSGMRAIRFASSPFWTASAVQGAGSTVANVAVFVKFENISRPCRERWVVGVVTRHSLVHTREN